MKFTCKLHKNCQQINFCWQEKFIFFQLSTWRGAVQFASATAPFLLQKQKSGSLDNTWLSGFLLFQGRGKNSRWETAFRWISEFFAAEWLFFVLPLLSTGTHYHTRENTRKHKKTQHLSTARPHTGRTGTSGTGITLQPAQMPSSGASAAASAVQSTAGSKLVTWYCYDRK